MYGHGTDGVSENLEEKQASFDLIFDFDPENTQHKEQLFKLKLKMFDQSVVKKSKAKTKKAEIRKAETPLEAVAAYKSFIK